MNDSNPGLPPRHDAIAEHNRIAKFYHYRTQYGESFFRRLAERVGLGPESLVLDLCCGTGAVAAGLAPYCKAIDAVDGAPDMIDFAAQHERISYHLFDIDSPDFAEWMHGRTYDLVTIGMGVHWLSDAVLDRLRRHLRPGGMIAILATGFTGPLTDSWYAEFHKVRSSLTKREMRDWTGEESLAALGYERLDRLEQIYRGKVGVTDLVNHLLSFSREAETVARRFDMVRDLLAKVLEPYLSNGKLTCHWTSSARLFVDQKSTAMPLRTQSP